MSRFSPDSAPQGNRGIVAVPWGNYRVYIAGGTGKFEGATGYLDNFGMADFTQNTVVLRYRGRVPSFVIAGNSGLGKHDVPKG